MRIALVVHGLAPHERTGVETHVAALAAALAARGEELHVFAPRPCPALSELAEREELRDGYRIHWLTANRSATSAAGHLDRPGAAEAFGEFLERVRPEVCHVHHLAGLGVGLLDQARQRGIPVVVTAHDFWAVCHRTTMLRPDLTRCSTVGDAELCARCDHAVSYLDGIAGLGDYQAGVLPGDLAPEQAAELHRRLAEPLEESELGPLRREREALDRRRREAFAAVDLVLAPSELVAERWIAGGLPRESVRRFPYAIPTKALKGLAAPASSEDPQAVVRFGFVGGLSKHKGLHVLLEAFEGLATAATLRVFGDSSDRPYVERLRAAADRAGAHWNGAFEARELPRVLEQIDVLCVPSIWAENAPFVVREAFAAGRPVLASRVGGLAESVRDEVDGFLVEPGSVDSWRWALTTLASDPALVRKLARNVRRPPDLARQSGELLEVYREVIDRARSRAPRPVTHLRTLAERFDELSREPFDDLLARVVGGARKLREGLLKGEPGPLTEAALGLGASVRDRLRDERRERRWLAQSARDLEAERAGLRRELDWLHGTLADREAALGEARAVAEQGELARRALAAERDARARAAEALEREREWLRGVLADREQELDWRRSELEQRGRALEEVERERAATAAELDAIRAGHVEQGAELERVRGHLEGATAEVEWRRELQLELERERDTLERERSALAGHEAWLRSQAGALAASLGAADLDEVPGAADLEHLFEASHERLGELARELEWRRSEMEAALGDGGALFRRLRERSALGRRMDGWGGTLDEEGE